MATATTGGPCTTTLGNRCRPSPAPLSHVLSTAKETAMKWETPSATDFRFGFEITMYVANR